ncbi:MULTISPECIES: MotA/TolQ/ExbB proton channel family protein [unclassified Anaeromyxobacter]|uniref:MotA/TolQ/ExbB proton channel family protein n=1 Tax=unclassified Anaeromyxobacter TaxID=2620896 RepID=UPI001F5A4249|nr:MULTISPECIES: MotA/TolQ/ExbB proton channel family protein [unclassified Anaeromyxobacter]
MTKSLFELFTRAGAEWVMLLLVALSAASVTVILERALYFALRRRTSPDLLTLLMNGRLEEARARIEGRRGLEAEVARAALDAAGGGPAAVQEAVACTIADRRLGYERGLSFLGTLGNNAPFLGLFGTVVGIIRAFSDLAVGGPKGAGAAAVMSGISEALVATAVGIFVAIPAVVAFNGFQRWLRTLITRAEAIGHALASHLEHDDVRAAARARLDHGRAGRRPEPHESKGAA